MIFKTKDIKIQAIQLKDKKSINKILEFGCDYVRCDRNEWHGCRLLYLGLNKNWYSTSSEVRFNDYLVKLDNGIVFKFSEEEFNLIFEKAK
jgi:hypothetical protein